jgi:dTDP-D-glucose 4,6-dehydratase
VLIHQISLLEKELERLLTDSPAQTKAVLQRTIASVGNEKDSISTIFGRTFNDLRFQIEWQRVKSEVSPAARVQLDRLKLMVQRKQTMERQLSSLAAARRMMALWHTIHIPIGMVLFTAAFIHIVAAVYYASLLR